MDPNVCYVNRSTYFHFIVCLGGFMFLEGMISIKSVLKGLMFKMKYLINKMHYNTLSQQVWDLIIGVFISILEVKGSNLTNGVFVLNNGKLTKYFSM
jgi:hypothetical protein